jgi:two-component system sensor histidine kinase AgrC
MSESTLILFTLGRVFFLISNIWLTYSFLTPRRPLWFQIFAYAGTFAAQYIFRGLLAPTGLDPFLLGYMITPFYLLPIALIFRGTIQAKFFVLFMVTSLSQFNFLICLFIELLIFDHMVGWLILAGQLLEFATIPLIRRYITPHINNILEIIDQQNPVFTLFPFLSFILLAVYGVQRAYLSSLFLPLVLSAIIISIAYYLIAISIDRTKRQQQLEKQLALQRDHFGNLNDSLATARATRHDLRHHLVTISEFLGKKDAAGAQEYLNRLCHYFDDSNIPTVCRHQPTDALVCHYLKLAKQQDIAVSTDLNIPDHLGIDDLDLCVIIGNCLENAIEACDKMTGSEARFIHIKAILSKGYLVIKIANSFDGHLQHRDGGFISSKRSTGDGIGLASVKTLAAKYQGQCLVSFDHQVFQVSVSLILPETVAAPNLANISG